MKKTLTILLLLMVIHSFGISQLYSQDYLNIKYTDVTYKYALIDDISEITFNAGGTEMTVTLNDASSNAYDISTIVEMTFDAGILGGGNPLPVELISFIAELNDNGIKLIWVTATEVNNYGFYVERSIFSDEYAPWTSIGFVQGSGNSNSPKSYEFIDLDLPNAKLEYRLKQIDNDGTFEYYNTTAIVNNSVTDQELINSFELFNNYPNPFNPSTTITYQIPKAGYVTLKVYDMLGRVVKILVDEYQQTGKYSIHFSSDQFASGMYYCRLSVADFLKTIKMNLVK